MSETLRGLWLEVRVIPVLLWSFSALTLGTALAARGRDRCRCGTTSGRWRSGC